MNSIFDAHLHTYGSFLDKQEDLISYLDKHGVDKAILTTTNRAMKSKIYAEQDPSTKSTTPRKKSDKVNRAFQKMKNMVPRGQLDHQDVIDLVKKAPNRFYPFFWFNPMIKEEDKERDYSILEEHFDQGFCGVKIHSGIHLVKIPRDVRELVEFMQEYNEDFPLYIHSVPKVLFFKGISSKDISKLAKSYPKLKIIVGHAGYAMEYAIELGLILKKFENVFFETSCSIPYGIFSLLKVVGQKRILFGSDAPITNPLQLEINKLLSLPLTSEQRKAIFYENTNRLLNA